MHQELSGFSGWSPVQVHDHNPFISKLKEVLFKIKVNVVTEINRQSTMLMFFSASSRSLFISLFFQFSFSLKRGMTFHMVTFFFYFLTQYRAWRATEVLLFDYWLESRNTHTIRIETPITDTTVMLLIYVGHRWPELLLGCVGVTIASNILERQCKAAYVEYGSNVQYSAQFYQYICSIKLIHRHTIYIHIPHTLCLAVVQYAVV